jgi:molybdopterin/thiamine biosynthesis adenylyltransferase
MPSFGEAARAKTGVGFVHTHPGADAGHSLLDDKVDADLSAVAERRTGQPHYLSLVIGGHASSPTFAARIITNDRIESVDIIRVVGERLRLIEVGGRAATVDTALFDRQIRAFGADGQAVLSSLRVGVVGAGGTGSAVCEQLVRLGVGRVVLIDDDVVATSNISRIYGARHGDEGKFKVHVVARHTNAIRATDKNIVVPIVGRVTSEQVAVRLCQCDVVFGCTDDQWGRSILSRLAYYYFIPLIDLGLVVTSDGRTMSEIVGRATIVVPGSSCLLCRGRIQPDAIRAEAVPEPERERLTAEGYVQGLRVPDPSVIPYTSLVASLGTSELLRRLFGLGDSQAADELLFRIDVNELRRNRVPCRQGHYCATQEVWGAGDTEPFLGVLWA